MSYRIQKTPKVKTCPCGEKFVPKKSIQKFHSPACELAHKSGNVSKDNLANLSQSVLFQIARGVFQQYIKLRDKDQRCITDGNPFTKSDTVNAGHLFPCNQFPGLVFNEDNCFAQKEHFNFRMGEIIIQTMTAANVEKRIGVERWKELKQLSESAFIRNYKYSKPELIDIINKYEKLNELKP